MMPIIVWGCCGITSAVYILYRNAFAPRKTQRMLGSKPLRGFTSPSTGVFQGPVVEHIPPKRLYKFHTIKFF